MRFCGVRLKDVHTKSIAHLCAHTHWYTNTYFLSDTHTHTQTQEPNTDTHTSPILVSGVLMMCDLISQVLWQDYNTSERGEREIERESESC